MTNPLEACLQELNEAVAKGLHTTDCVVCQELDLDIERLRHKYNAIVIAYRERTD